MKIILTILMFLMLSSFGHKDITITITPNLPAGPNGGTVYGWAIWNDTECAIVIAEETYPYCLEHELKHCREGHWHDPDVPNTEYCGELPDVRRQ